MRDQGAERRETARDARPDGPDIPEHLRESLRPWVDLDAVGVEGLWSWLEVVLPLIPLPRSGEPGPSIDDRGDRLRELARDLVDCASDRARLVTSCDHYYRDNVALARRVKALEAAQRTGSAGGDVAASDSEEPIERVTERYLPRR